MFDNSWGFRGDGGIAAFLALSWALSNRKVNVEAGRNACHLFCDLVRLGTLFG